MQATRRIRKRPLGGPRAEEPRAQPLCICVCSVLQRVAVSKRSSNALEIHLALQRLE